ncbi:GumC domain-containing protein [Bartonella sp. LJL80]
MGEMKNEIESQSRLSRFLPQNLALVLLFTALWVSIIWVVCLFQSPVYEAQTRIQLNNSIDEFIDGKKQRAVVALLLSDPVYHEVANALGYPLTSDTRKKFHSSVLIKQEGSSIGLRFVGEDAQTVRLGLVTWLSAFERRLDDNRATDRKTVSQNEINQRNALIDSALADFRQSLGTMLANTRAVDTLDPLYAELAMAIADRTASETRIDAIQQVLDAHEAPMDLAFIANDASVARITQNVERLNSQIAYMEAQLGRSHPQIKAMDAERTVLLQERDKTIELVIQQLYRDADMALSVEQRLRDQLQQVDNFDLTKADTLLSALDVQLKKLSLRFVMEDIGQTSPTELGALLNNTPVEVERLSVFERYHSILIWSAIFGLLFFWVVISFLSYLVRRFDKQIEVKQSDGKEPNVSPVPKELLELGFSDTMAFLRHRAVHLVAVAGPDAAKASARIAIGLKSDTKSVLLVDVSANQIGTLIGPHRGFTDVLTGDSKLNEVIYTDHDTGIDILPQGLAAPIRASDFSSDIPALLDELRHSYSIVLFAMASRPHLGGDDIRSSVDCVIITSKSSEICQDWLDFFDGTAAKHFINLAIDQ